MNSITCDNCPATIPHESVGDSDWIRVGWVNGHIHDACSAGCAHALIDTMVAAEATNPTTTEPSKETTP